MRKISVFVVLATLLVSTTFAKQRPLPAELNTKVTKVVSFTDLDQEMVKNVLAGEHPHIAIECMGGTELPLKFFGNFGLFSAKLDPNFSITLEKTCYLRFVKKKPNKTDGIGYISFDLKEWQKLKNFQITEQLKVGMSPDHSHISVETSLEPELN